MTEPTSPYHAGNDVFCVFTPLDTGEVVEFTYWDVWMLMVLTNSFGGNWGEMENHFRKPGYSSRYAGEGHLNHLRHLRQALEQVGLTPAELLVQADKGLLSKQRAKAKTKVFELKVQNNEKSTWMIQTPRKLLSERSLRGYWDQFPVSPANYASQLKALYKPSGFYTEDQSFGLSTKLSAFIEKQERKLGKASLSEVFALYRALLTVVLEKMDGVDDSFGVIGDLYGEAFTTYTQLDREEFGGKIEIFFQDLLELLIWEDYGFTDREQPDFFAQLSAHEIPIVEQILKTEHANLVQYEINYQAEEALTMLALLYTQQKMFDRFVPLAQVMGTRHWRRITRMSEAAEGAGQPELALAVYEACLGPGFHEKHLREEYEKLKSRLGYLP